MTRPPFANPHLLLFRPVSDLALPIGECFVPRQDVLFNATPDGIGIQEPIFRVYAHSLLRACRIHVQTRAGDTPNRKKKKKKT